MASEETPTQLAARLRREKRQAKLATTGEDRLAKIKQLNGGVAPPEEVLGGPTVAPPSSTNSSRPQNQASVDDDPDEVDISSHPYTPANASGSGTPRNGGRGGAGQDQDEMMRAMMSMQARQQGEQAEQGGEEDPMVKMMQSMMGMMGGQPGGPGGMEGMEGMPQMLSAMMGQGGGAQAQRPADKSAYLWRITHAIFALTLAAYIALTSTFNGTQLARLKTIDPTTGLDTDPGIGPRLFWIFATSELLLQSTRWFMEKGQLQGGGWLATIANSGFVPEPYAGYIKTVGSYLRIWTTVVSDAMVVVFVLGCLAWWKGGVGASV